ncbi:MAG: hypothetical protein Kow00104_03220 [Rhodothalassiaceae bacterium]
MQKGEQIARRERGRDLDDGIEIIGLHRTALGLAAIKRRDGSGREPRIPAGGNGCAHHGLGRLSAMRKIAAKTDEDAAIGVRRLRGLLPKR